MCISDWRAGRYMRSQVTQVSASTGAITIQQSRQRVGIKFYASKQIAAAGIVDILMDGAPFTSLTQGDQRCSLNLANDGDLPTHQFTVSLPPGTTLVTVVETFLTEDFIAKASNEFIQQLGVG